MPKLKFRIKGGSYYKHKYATYNYWNKRYATDFMIAYFGSRNRYKHYLLQYWKDRKNPIALQSDSKAILRGKYPTAKFLEMVEHGRFNPVTNRRLNIIRASHYQNRQSKAFAKQLLNYLSKLLESSTSCEAKLYLYKPLITCPNGLLEQSKVGNHKWHIVDNYGFPILRRFQRGGSYALQRINARSHTLGFQLLDIPTEFIPDYYPNDCHFDPNSRFINVHKQGLAVANRKLNKNDKRHLTSIIKNYFCKATGYSKNEVYVGLPDFQFRHNSSKTEQYFSSVELSHTQLDLPVAVHHQTQIKIHNIYQYNQYGHKQYVSNQVSKKHPRQDCKNFEAWNYRRAFIMAALNDVHGKIMRCNIQPTKRVKAIKHNMARAITSFIAVIHVRYIDLCNETKTPKDVIGNEAKNDPNGWYHSKKPNEELNDDSLHVKGVVYDNDTSNNYCCDLRHGDLYIAKDYNWTARQALIHHHQKINLAYKRSRIAHHVVINGQKQLAHAISKTITKSIPTKKCQDALQFQNTYSKQTIATIAAPSWFEKRTSGIPP